MSQITAAKVLEYQVLRQDNSIGGRPPSRSTMHQEIVTLGQGLKTALRKGWLDNLPDMSMPYRAHGKISHRAWFSPAAYQQLYEATRRHARKPKRKRWCKQCEQLHHCVLLMANTGLRPDEAARIEYRDVSVVHDEGTDETILEIEVRGKRGVGYCKSTSGAVGLFERLMGRNSPERTDLVFPTRHRELFNKILDEEDLKFVREGNRRTAYSLRHTFICLRLSEGADIYQIAKNCRTSVEMIENH